MDDGWTDAKHCDPCMLLCQVSLKSPKIDIVKNKPYYTSSLRVLEITKIGLSENLTQSFPRRKKFPI